MRKHLVLFAFGITFPAVVTLILHDVHYRVTASIVDSTSHHAANAQGPHTLSQGVVMRLQKRVYRWYGKAIPTPDLASALTERQRLLHRDLALLPVSTNGTTFDVIDASMSAHPAWIRAVFMDGTLAFTLDADAIHSFFSSWSAQLPQPTNSLVTGIDQRHGVYYVDENQPASDGYSIDVPSLTAQVVHSYAGTGSSLHVPVEYLPGKVLSASGVGLGELTLLATGRSNYAGSGEGRINNVRTGLTQFINNVIIPAGQTFSFNEAVNNMRSGDWKDALVIMNGTDLVSYPGGGICQVATTVFRAALLAGLPIKERANHSLYVTYYEKYGVGIDATVFPQRQDLQFENNTGHPLVLQAGYDGFEAFVRLYGVPDGRSVAMDGPFFETNQTQELQHLLGASLHGNEIAWLQQVVDQSGVSQTNVILSRYVSIPRSLKTEYAQVSDQLSRS